MKNTTYEELAKLIEKVTALGIHVIEDGQRHTEKAMTVIITEENGIKEMIPFKTIKDDEVVTGLSPFAWRLDKNEFIKWARVATSQPFAIFNKSLAKLVRLMTVESFESLRKHEHLEDEMLKYIIRELDYTGIGKIKLSKPALFHLTLIYGGLLHREKGIELFIEQLMNMCLSKEFIPDRCRSCKFCKLTDKGTMRYCWNPLNEGFVIPRDILVGKLAESFPDIKIKQYQKYNEAVTRYIPGDLKECEFYTRRK